MIQKQQGNKFWAHQTEIGQEGGGVKAAPGDALDGEGQAIHAQDLPLCDDEIIRGCNTLAS